MHIKFSLLFVLLAGVFLVQQTHGHKECSIKEMKKFALIACEHLVKSRPTREIGNSNFNLLDGCKSHKSLKKHYYIQNRNFPKHGYIKVNKCQLKDLLNAEVSPPYEASKKIHFEKKERYRRSDSSGNGHKYIDYCCLNKCETDFC